MPKDDERPQNLDQLPPDQLGPGQLDTPGASAAARRKSNVEALEFERLGYERRGLKDRAKQVDDQIKAIAGAAKPAKKSTRS